MRAEDHTTSYLAVERAYSERDYAMAKRILRTGAEQAHAQSQCMLGSLRQQGKDVPKAPKSAVK